MVDRSHDAGRRLADMLDAGFSVRSEPFLQAMLLSWRRHSLRVLEDKTRIACDESACLMGVLDETGTLDYGQAFLQIRKDDKDRVEPIVGRIAVAKNPCLHPGDIRVLKAVGDIPRLAHLVNVLVFPQKGKRPHPDECSGSDLDGDEYFVTWRPGLVPSDVNVEEPMDYTPADPIKVEGQVTMEDIFEFMIKYMQNDMLGVICHNHMAIADSSMLHAKDPRCKELARQQSIAVDYPKTGVPAEIKDNHRPTTYPDFMKKPNRVTYESKKVLGELYRDVCKVQAADGKNASQASHPRALAHIPLLLDNLHDNVDEALVVPGYKDHLADARAKKRLYDGQMLDIMRKYGAKSEIEAIGGCFLESAGVHRRRKLHDVQVAVSYASF